jgi:predicted nucleic-acid-binding Zn-ribbon protein
MKQDNQCTRCGSSNLLRIPVVPGDGPHIVIGDRLMHSIPVTQFVCSDCGYIENWVADENELARLKEQYGSGK